MTALVPCPRSRGSLLSTLALILLAGTLAPHVALASRIFVPRAYKSLQTAIDSARAGDTVWVAPGTYFGPFVIKKRLVLFGDGGSDSTILDGKGNARVLHVEGVGRASILGFRIQNGKAPGGSGIYCLRDTALMIASCVIKNNWETGVASWQCSPIQIADSEISDNHGTGVTASDSRMQLVHVNLRRNEGPSGGGLALTNSELLARNSLFEENRAMGGTGGGIYSEDSQIIIQSCTLRGNSAAAGGGGIAGRDSTILRIRSTLFAGNHSSTGGAILTDRSSIDVSGSIFSKNRSVAGGSAIHLLGRRFADVNPQLNNNTFYRNGVLVADGSDIFAIDVAPEIIRNIFVVDSTEKNRPVIGTRGVPRYECNLVYAYQGTIRPPTSTTLMGNPSFCDAEKENFHLRDLSPALVAPCGVIGAEGKGCASFRLVPSQ